MVMEDLTRQGRGGWEGHDVNGRNATGSRIAAGAVCLLTALSLASCAGKSPVHASSKAPGPLASSSRTPVSAAPGRIVFRRFLKADDTSGALFISAADGSGERQITTPTGTVGDDAPDWSPDGTRILFTRTADAGTAQEQLRLFTMSADGTGITPVTPARPTGAGALAAGDNDGAFSPDGRHIACGSFHGNVVNDEIQVSEIIVMDADGRHRHPVTRSAAYSGDDGGVAWSPDGKQLVYAHSNAGASAPAGGRALFIINADGSHRRQLTPWSLGAGGTPEWSASTNTIAFRAVDDEEAGKGNFFTIKPDGTGLAQVTHFTDTVISHKVSFSPDGRRLVFAKETDGGKNDLFTIRVDGSDLRAVTKTPEADSAPDWSPAG